MPTEYGLFLEEAAKRGSEPFKKWILCYTDDKAPYYFNEITREISWEEPDDFIETNRSLYKNDANCSNKTKVGPSNNAENVSEILQNFTILRPVRIKSELIETTNGCTKATIC